jgi:hypothetical protein
VSAGYIFSLLESTEEGGKTMNEVNHQTTPALLLPGRAEKLTVETAIALLQKKKTHLETDPGTNENVQKPGNPSPARKPSVGHGTLGIPFTVGTADYSRAYYWCRKLGKTFPEFKDDFLSGKLKRNYKKPDSTKSENKQFENQTAEEQKRTHREHMASLARAESRHPITHPDVISSEAAMSTPSHQTIQIIAPNFDEGVKILKMLDTALTTMNTNISAMNNNILELRREVTAMRGDIKRYSGGKHA